MKYQNYEFRGRPSFHKILVFIMVSLLATSKVYAGVGEGPYLTLTGSINMYEDTELSSVSEKLDPITQAWGAYLEIDSLIRKAIPRDLNFDEVTLEWALDNLPIICYHPKDSRPVGIRRQRTRAKKWKVFVVHGEDKKELPNDVKVKDVNEEIALSLLN